MVERSVREITDARQLRPVAALPLQEQFGGDSFTFAMNGDIDERVIPEKSFRAVGHLRTAEDDADSGFPFLELPRDLGGDAHIPDVGAEKDEVGLQKIF